MAGTTLLDYTGVLDFVPAVVDKTRETASKLNSGVRSTANSAVEGAGSVLDNYFGSYINYAKHKLNWSVSSLIEEGRQKKVDCYSMTCQPGRICYSPTCVRSQNYEVDIINLTLCSG